MTELVVKQINTAVTFYYIIEFTYFASTTIMSNTSLLISTYNWPAALKVCLDSVCIQSVLPKEVIICDDGSGEETAALIECLKKDFPVPLIHIWHADEGFRLASIRNKGMAAATGDYLIQIDGDLQLHRHFVKDHVAFRQKGAFTTGSRTMLSSKNTALLINNAYSDKLKVMGNRNFFNRLRVPWAQHFLATRYKNKGRHLYYVKGCNMAFWKEDIMSINGYNEDFTGWGREDSEIAIRLMNVGIRKRFLKLGGICYHLHHREASRAMEESNLQLMNRAIREKTTWAVNGIGKYLLSV